MKPRLPFWFLLVVACLAAQAEVRLAAPFRDHAVLQRGQPVPVWGWAEPEERIEIEFAGHRLQTAADAEGRWRVVLPALAASAEPRTLGVRGSSAVLVRDVLVGDVWLASGQSNMEWRVEQAGNPTEEIAAANYPAIRQFDVPNRVATQPEEICTADWVVCSPQTAAKFSAVAYYFAREMHLSTGVPVGILNSTWGGTPVESWMSRETLSGDSAFAPALQRWERTLAVYPEEKKKYEQAHVEWKREEAAAKKRGPEAHEAFRKKHPAPRAPRGPGHHWTPAGLYNGMIRPLVPYALAGAIWYQAESNADYPGDYTPLFMAMIRQWRAEWGREFPFYFVQIANFQGTAADRKPGQWAWLREAQAQALTLPKTGMAVAIDIGTPGNIHPKNKQEVGRRLALLVRRDLFGAKEEASGPVLKQALPVNGGLRLVFDHAVGLESGGQPLAGFEVAGEDRKFLPAVARIEQGEVIVSNAQVPQPVAVRYAWANAPEAPLRNAAGLPAAPFRTDCWPQP